MTSVFTDTSANLPTSALAEWGITVIPFSYAFDGEPSAPAPEGDFDGKAFYGRMRAGSSVTTSMINIATFCEYFESALKGGSDVLHISMSGGISGTANAAAMAAEELREKYPGRKLTVIDTYAASMGEGLLVLRACELLRSGASFDSVVETITKERNTLCQYFTVDDLIYLRRGGRLSGAAAFFGNMLNIKPILMGDDTGHIILREKMRGSRKSLDRLAEKYAELTVSHDSTIAIAHADNEKAVEYLLGKLREAGFRGECITVCYEPVTGSHVGPGTVALFYPGIRK